MRLLLLVCLFAVAVAQRGFFQLPTFNNRNRGQSFRRPSRPQQRPQQNTFTRGGGGAVDDRNGRSEYHYSWRHDGGRDYTGQQAASYCRGLGGGWAAVSINSGNENTYVSRVVQGERLDYIWTGGSKQGGWRWADGSGLSTSDWSHTGGARRAQPDNREGNEFCLAILNNFYRDGVKWHDVACSHKKPVICERGA